MKKKSIKTLKKKAWKAFSEYIRRKYSGSGGLVKCVTCNKIDHWKSMHAGHYVDGRNNTVLFDERLVWPQCLTKESKIRLFNGENKSIKDVKKGDKLWGFDKNTFERKVSFIISKHRFIPKELYEIELQDGRKFFATPDHQVVVNKEWRKVKDMLHDCTTFDILEL
jgi:hypothetical protein